MQWAADLAVFACRGPSDFFFIVRLGLGLRRLVVERAPCSADCLQRPPLQLDDQDVRPERRDSASGGLSFALDVCELESASLTRIVLSPRAPVGPAADPATARPLAQGALARPGTDRCQGEGAPDSLAH